MDLTMPAVYPSIMCPSVRPWNLSSAAHAQRRVGVDGGLDGDSLLVGTGVVDAQEMETSVAEHGSALQVHTQARNAAPNNRQRAWGQWGPGSRGPSHGSSGPVSTHNAQAKLHE